jgi:hypothetical protein
MVGIQADQQILHIRNIRRRPVKAFIISVALLLFTNYTTIAQNRDIEGSRIEIEGIWVLPGVEVNNFLEVPQSIFIEKLDDDHIILYWHQPFFSAPNWIAVLEYDSSSSEFTGVTNDGTHLTLGFSFHRTYSVNVFISLESIDEGVMFIPLDYEDAK